MKKIDFEKQRSQGNKKSYSKWDQKKSYSQGIKKNAPENPKEIKKRKKLGETVPKKGPKWAKNS